MIEQLVNTVTFAFNSINSTLAAFSQLGEIIVTSIWFILSTAVALVNSLLTFLAIICEDNSNLFSKDIPEFTYGLLDLVYEQTLFLTVGGTFIFEALCSSVSTIFDTIIGLVNFVHRCIYLTGIFISTATTFLKNTAWFTITFIPIQLPILIWAILSELIEAFSRLIFRTYLEVVNVKNFIFHVPLESFIGLGSCFIVIRFYITFRSEIHIFLHQLYWMIIRKVRWCYYAFQYYLANSENRFISRLLRNQSVRPRALEDFNFDEDEDVGIIERPEGLCVVCHERPKSVLVLPCRHICMCRECCVTLYNYQRNCPVCRTFIFHSLIVYM